MIQYFDPTSNHFARLPAIQQRIIRHQAGSRSYMLGRLPLLTDALHELTQSQLHAAKFLNLLCASQTFLVPRFMKGKDPVQLLEVRIRVELKSLRLVGTVPEILSQSKISSKSLRWILNNYGTYIDATRL